MDINGNYGAFAGHADRDYVDYSEFQGMGAKPGQILCRQV